MAVRRRPGGAGPVLTPPPGWVEVKPGEEWRREDPAGRFFALIVRSRHRPSDWHVALFEKRGAESPWLWVRGLVRSPQEGVRHVEEWLVDKVWREPGVFTCSG